MSNNIQHEFVVDITTEVQLEQQHNTPIDHPISNLVDEVQFTNKLREAYPGLTHNPSRIWHGLFGNEPSGRKEGLNKDVAFLTEDSCAEIIKYYQLFLSGIDFNNLPSGFLLAKNPETGVRDVLHYSEFLAKNVKKSNPLAVVLSPKEAPAKQAPITFAHPQSLWYNFLRRKIKAGGIVFCSEEELKNAFITFSRTVDTLGLTFPEKPDFSSLHEEVNPIVLLGRWHTVLTQPNLKKVDLQAQMNVLPQLPLTASYGGLRAISDHQFTDHPCGFLLPEMVPTRKYHAVYREFTPQEINSINDFWVYVAYQPNRNSINYYLKAIEAITKIGLKEEESVIKMLRMLAATSTGVVHSANTPEKEQIELNSWVKFCNLIKDLPTANATLTTLTIMFKAEDRVKNFYIYRLEKLKQLPNASFLFSYAQLITDQLTQINLGVALIKAPTQLDLAPELTALSEKLEDAIEINGAGIYDGARFYLVNDEWQQLNLKKYVELQHLLSESYIIKPISYSRLLASHLSTFTILNQEHIYQIRSLIHSATLKELTFTLNLFHDATKAFAMNDLLTLLTFLRDNRQDTPFISILEHVETHFKEGFPEGYFAKKKQELLDANHGLNEEQLNAINRLKLPTQQRDYLISIETELLQNNPSISPKNLDEFHDLLLNLHSVLSPTDFNFVLEKLAFLRKQLPQEIAPLNQLIRLLMEQRSINDFKQIYFRNQIEKCTDKTLIPKFIAFSKTIKPMIKPSVSMSSVVMQDLLSGILLSADFSTFMKNGVDELEVLLPQIEQILVLYPHLQRHFLEAISNIPDKFSKDYFKNLKSFVRSINQVCILLEEDKGEKQQHMLLIYSLFARFQDNPMALDSLYKEIAQASSTEAHIRLMLLFANKLIKDENDINEFINLIKKIEGDTSLFDLFVKECSNPPYPSLKTLNQWIDDGNLATEYTAFSMLPHGERRLDFAFQAKEVAKQKVLFKGMGDEDLFSAAWGKSVAQQLQANRQKTLMELRKEFNDLRLTAVTAPLSNQQKQALLSVGIEMLARTTAQFDDQIPPSLISQELNTTQVMALYAMLTNPNAKLISEIGTGEGKSRISMILAACQVAQGKTVDFMTSDMPLAERDFLTYNEFFTSLNINTSLISLNTPKQLYQRGGVNFTDNSQLLLLRNRSDIIQDSFAFLDPDASKRCLLIDEVDKFIHDKAKDSYNYATASQNLKDFTWVYPLLVGFVRDYLNANPGQTFKPEELIQQFLDYVGQKDFDEYHLVNLANLRESQNQQLVTWLKSAHTALHMKADQDYKVSSEEESKLVRVRDAEGYVRYTRSILVLDTGRPVEGASFALGVHQCLCAIENQKAGKESFIILPENETQRSLFPVSFIEQYQKGALYGLSGTARHEAPVANELINYEKYDYLIVPRHKTVRREDKNIWLARDETQQIEFLKRSLREKLSENPQRPVLLICKNDKQSELIYKALTMDNELLKLMKECTRVHGLTDKKDEKNAVEQGGEPGHVTLSTVGMFGRGVDINAANLFVCSLYVPTFEDEKQIKGRTGRAGKEGEYRMIPNRIDPDCPLDGETYNIRNEIDKAQRAMALQAAKQEEVAKLYAHFLEYIHQAFIEAMSKAEDTQQPRLLQTWQRYLSDLQKAWDLQREAMLDMLEHSNEEEFKQVFNAFTQTWKEKAPIDAQSKTSTSFANQSTTTYTALSQQKTFFKPQRTSIGTQRNYDVADDGQARVYSSLFVQELAVLKGNRVIFANTRAWLEGRGVLFADLKATLSGERPLFANLRATISRLIEEFKARNTEDQQLDDSEQSELGTGPAV
jgi:hypothetical protein